MNGGLVADQDIGADGGRVSLIGDVNDGAVILALNILVFNCTNFHPPNSSSG